MKTEKECKEFIYEKGKERLAELYAIPNDEYGNDAYKELIESNFAENITELQNMSFNELWETYGDEFCDPYNIEFMYRSWTDMYLDYYATPEERKEYYNMYND